MTPAGELTEEWRPGQIGAVDATVVSAPPRRPRRIPAIRRGDRAVPARRRYSLDVPDDLDLGSAIELERLAPPPSSNGVSPRYEALDPGEWPRPAVADQRKPATFDEVREWYGLHTDLLPFASRDINPYDVVRVVREEVERVPVTKPMIVITEVAGAHDDLDPTHFPRSVTDTAFRLAGSWRLPRYRRNNRVCWANPEYVHREATYPALRDPAYRRAYLRECASLGLLGYEEIAPRFGVERETLWAYCPRNGIPFRTWRRHGRAMMGRTWHTAHEWGMPLYEIADAVGVEYGVVQKWIERYSRGSGFEPPADPTIAREAVK